MALRLKMATASLVSVTMYTCLSSGLTTRSLGTLKARPSTHVPAVVPLLPSSLMQAFLVPSWERTPVVVLRFNATTALESWAAA